MTDKEIIKRFVKALGYGTWSSYRPFVRDMSILWRGNHYFLIRTGSVSGSRLIYLVDKAGVMFDETSSPLEKLAATYHPVQKSRAASPQLLHTSRVDDNRGRFRGRFSASLCKKIIRFAQAEDEKYESNLPRWIAAHEKQRREAREFEAAGRKSLARLIKLARRDSKSVETNRRKTLWYKEVDVEFELSSITFVKNSHGTGFSVDIHSNLTEDQFVSLYKLLVEFEKENKQ